MAVRQQAKRLGAALLAGGAFLLAGCAPSVVGKWNGSVPAGGQTLPVATEFKKDNTFTQNITVAVMPALPAMQVDISGTYKVEGDKLSLSVNKATVAGKDMTSRLPPQLKSGMGPSGTFKIEGDKMTLTGSDGQATIFNRVKE
jgi:hypothetical protein